MKRFFALCLALLCVLALVACSEADEAIEANATTDGGNDIVEVAYFIGKVVEVYDTTALLEVSDSGNQDFAIGDKVVVNTAIEGAPAFAVGDYLRVVFDGKIAKSYPPQVFNVFSIYKTDEQGKHIG